MKFSIWVSVKKNEISSRLVGKFSDISQWISSPFFVNFKNDQEVHMTLITDTIINGNPIIKKVVFKVNNTWDFFIGQKAIDLEECNIDNSFVPTRMCIQNICSLASKIRLCFGKKKC